jgi:hypothetical protein
MENNTLPTPPSGVVVTSTPTPPTATPSVAQNATIGNEGGNVETKAEGGLVSDAKSFIKSVNWLEIGFMVLGALGIIYTINYYRYKQKESDVANKDMQRQLDEVKMNVQSAMKGKYQSI